MAEKNESKKAHRLSEFIPEEAVEHAKAARAEFRRSYESLFPPEFITSRRAARKEMLLAAREIINHAIDRIETREKGK